jgi:hypothetical protein
VVQIGRMPGNSHERHSTGRAKRLRKGQPALCCRLDDRLEAQFCEYVREGLPIEACCALVGISKQSFYSWRARGEAEAEENTRYAQFAKAVELANAEALRKLHNIVKASNPQWILERRFPNEYGPPKTRVETELSGSIETRGDHRITISCSDEPGLMDLLKKIPFVDADGRPITEAREDVMHGRNGGGNGNRP